MDSGDDGGEADDDTPDFCDHGTGFRVVGVHSTYRTEPVAGAHRLRLDPDTAITAALAAMGIDLSDLDHAAVAVPRWAAVSGNLVLAWQVGIERSESAGGGSFLAWIRDRTSALIDFEKLGGAFCPAVTIRKPDGTTSVNQPAGLVTGIGSAYLDREPLEHPAAEFTPDTFFEAWFLGTNGMAEVPLREMCSWNGPDASALNGVTVGRYARVIQRVGAQHRSPDYDLRVRDKFSAVFRVDTNPSGVISPSQPTVSIANPGPDVSANVVDDDSEALLDETMAYYHIDRQARFFATRFHHELSRATNVNPDLEVRVNDISETLEGPDNSNWHLAFDANGTLSAFEARYNVRVQMGKGSIMQPIVNDFSAFGGAPVDLYAALDWTRDGTALAHEFTHVVIWDVSELREGATGSQSGDPTGVQGIRGPYHEGMADYFAGSALNRPTVLDFLQQKRDMRSRGSDVIVVPFDTQTGEEHHDGLGFSRPFWDLRERMEQLKREVPVFTSGSMVADRIAWGSVQRVGPSIRDFREALADSLATDSDVFNKLLHYEILGAFAGHGIKLESPIAIITPRNFLLDGRRGETTLHARGYLGSQTAYIAEFATDPSLFGPLNPKQDPGVNYFRITSDDPNFPIERLETTPTTDVDDYVVDLTLSSAQLAALAAGANAPEIPIFMQLSTIGVGGTFRNSHINGAGSLILQGSDPGTIYITPGAPGCSCEIAGTHRSSAVLLLSSVALCLILGRRGLRRE